MSFNPDKMPEELQREWYTHWQSPLGAITNLLAFGGTIGGAILGLGPWLVGTDRLWIPLLIIVGSLGATIPLHFWRKRRFIMAARRRGMSLKQAREMWAQPRPYDG